MEERYLDLVNHCKVISAINQVETHVFRQQKKLRELECQIETRHESWSLLACGQNNIWNNPVLVRIVKSHDRSVSQIALRFLVQQGIIVIPKTANRSENRNRGDAYEWQYCGIGLQNSVNN